MLLRARRGVTYRGVTLSPPTRPRSPGFLMALTEIRARDGCQPGGRAAVVPLPGQHVLPDGVYPPGEGHSPVVQEKAPGQAARSRRCGPCSAAVAWGRTSPGLVNSPSALGRGREEDARSPRCHPASRRVPAWAPPVTSLLPEVVPKTFRGSVNPLCPSQRVLIPTRSRGCPCPAQGRERVLLEPRRRWRR